MSGPAHKGIDKNILFRLQQGEEAAFDAIYWEYGAWVYNFIISLLYDKSLAEDLTQNVFLKIWERRETIDPEKSFESYLFTIARHLVYKETEHQLQNEAAMDMIRDKIPQSDEMTEEMIDAESLRQYITSLIEQLPPARREIYQLSRVKQLSNKEIATRLSISEKTVETQLYRSLRFLKSKLSEDSGLLILLISLCIGE